MPVCAALVVFITSGLGCQTHINQRGTTIRCCNITSRKTMAPLPTCCALHWLTMSLFIYSRDHCGNLGYSGQVAQIPTTTVCNIIVITV